MLCLLRSCKGIGIFAGIQWTSDLNSNLSLFLLFIVPFDCLIRILTIILQHLFTFYCHFSASIKEKASGIRLRVRVGSRKYGNSRASPTPIFCASATVRTVSETFCFSAVWNYAQIEREMLIH